MNDEVHVAVGVIKDSAGRVLLAQRANHLHQGGLWEFPGGKVEAHESVRQALIRELNEELGIEISSSCLMPLIQIRYSYPDKNVLLDVWQVERFSGDPTGREGQPVQWVHDIELNSSHYPLPAANAGIVKAIRLSDKMMVTGHADNEDVFLSKVHAGLSKGLKLIQFRVTEQSLQQQLRLFDLTFDFCKQFDASLIFNTHSIGSLEKFSEFFKKAAGVHLSSGQLMSCTSKMVPKGKFLGASCHNLHELNKAHEIDADYVTLSPVKKTASHPRADSLGWDEFSALVERINIPVFALGGMEEADLKVAKMHGAQGIAAISAYW